MDFKVSARSNTVWMQICHPKIRSILSLSFSSSYFFRLHSPLRSSIDIWEISHQRQLMNFTTHLLISNHIKFSRYFQFDVTGIFCMHRRKIRTMKSFRQFREFEERWWLEWFFVTFIISPIFCRQLTQKQVKLWVNVNLKWNVQELFICNFNLS